MRKLISNITDSFVGQISILAIVSIALIAGVAVIGSHFEGSSSSAKCTTELVLPGVLPKDSPMGYTTTGSFGVKAGNTGTAVVCR